MRSFVTSIKGFFRFEQKDNKEKGMAFDKDKNQYVIPMYQREYTWTEKNVHDFVRDIEQRNKFLGNIMLEEKEDFYEVVDGQQRLTTTILILTDIYNRLKSGDKETIDQEKVRKMLFNERGAILRNDSVGNYIYHEENRIYLDISHDNEVDIYYQREQFEKIVAMIHEEFDKLEKQDSFRIDHFFENLEDCQFNVLLREQGDKEKVEKVFVDINLKLMSLDAADIFKGICFERYDSERYDELKSLWVELYKCAKRFQQTFDGSKYNGRKKENINAKDDLRNYLYTYLIIRKNDEGRITKNLKNEDFSVDGKQILEGKNSQYIKDLLQEMINFGDCILEFYDNVQRENYIFEDICHDSANYSEDRDSMKNLRKMCRVIIEKANTVDYSKTLFQMLVFWIKEHEILQQDMTFEIWKKIVSNYYVYVYLFKFISNRDKTAIDENAFIILYNPEICTEGETSKVKEISKEIKRMRSGERNLESYLNKRGISFNKKNYAEYSIMDYFNSNKNYVTKLYLTEDGYTQEHLIILDTKQKKVNWRGKTNEEIILENNELIRKYRNTIFNSLIITEEFNNELDRDDIVEKIRKIYQNFGTSVPKHIEIIVGNIEKLNTYRILEDMKEKDVTKEELQKAYNNFVEEYFSEDNRECIDKALKDGFKGVFRNG